MRRNFQHYGRNGVALKPERENLTPGKPMYRPDPCSVSMVFGAILPENRSLATAASRRQNLRLPKSDGSSQSLAFVHEEGPGEAWAAAQS